MSHSSSATSAACARQVSRAESQAPLRTSGPLRRSGLARRGRRRWAFAPRQLPRCAARRCVHAVRGPRGGAASPGRTRPASGRRWRRAVPPRTGRPADRAAPFRSARRPHPATAGRKARGPWPAWDRRQRRSVFRNSLAASALRASRSARCACHVVAKRPPTSVRRIRAAAPAPTRWRARNFRARYDSASPRAATGKPARCRRTSLANASTDEYRRSGDFCSALSAIRSRSPLSRRRRSPSFDACARTFWLLLEDRALELAANESRLVRTCTCQQLVEQHAERVDVGRRRRPGRRAAARAPRSRASARARPRGHVRRRPIRRRRAAWRCRSRAASRVRRRPRGCWKASDRDGRSDCDARAAPPRRSRGRAQPFVDRRARARAQYAVIGRPSTRSITKNGVPSDVTPPSRRRAIAGCCR